MTRGFTVSGRGLHSGQQCNAVVTFEENLRCHVFHTPNGDIDAVNSNICPDSRLATDLCHGTARIRTVEHLMFALSAFRNRAAITVDGPELPALDGSAHPWMTLLTAAGADPGVHSIPLETPLRAEHGDSVAEVIPLRDGECATYTIEIDFNGAPVGPTHLVFRPFVDSLMSLASARTFALESQITDIRRAGYGAGADLDNALIIGTDGPLNKNGMRLPDEPIRHKLLDAIGDLSLLGGLPRAHLNLKRPGHRLIHLLTRAIANNAASQDRPAVEF